MDIMIKIRCDGYPTFHNTVKPVTRGHPTESGFI